MGVRNISQHAWVLCLNETKRAKRIAFCNSMMAYNLCNVIWGDEKWFCVGGGPQKTWIFPNQPRYEKFLHAHPLKVMVWGGITYAGRLPIFFFQDNVNSDSYCMVLNHVKRWVNSPNSGMRLNEVYLQQDNARPHVSNKSLQHARSIGVKILP
eukprot:PhF_6_TR40633/c1_g1_i4/m.60991